MGPLPNDLRADLIRHYLDVARTAARSRDWATVVEVADDVLVLDHDNADALTLRTLADRHVGGSRPGGGRRQETVLFADLVGSTALANRVDVEHVKRLTRTYEQACTPVLTALGGYVHRFVGDGILASFGYPTSHEDDAVRAVHAALDLLAAVAAASAALGEPGDLLEVRVGVASGVLVHGDRGGGDWRQPGDLFGPAVNMAARLHELAAPGQIVVSEPTAALVSRSFDLEPLGPHPLKGFDAPVMAYRVVRRSALPAAAMSRPASPFIGRQGELRQLVERWEHVSATEASGAPPSPGATLSITGDPGVGKSRLVHELVQRAASRPGAVVELQCSAYRSASPLYPVRAAIERYSGIELDDDDSARLDKVIAVVQPTGLDLDQLLPPLVLLLELDVGDRVTAPELSPLQLREVTLGVLHQCVTQIAARAATILVCEDAQWADPSTRALLTRIVSAPPPGLLSVITARTAPEWLEDAAVESIVVEPLAYDETRALVNAVSSDALPAAVVVEIAERSDGIPLFVEQLADSLATSASGVLSRRGAIPASLAELLQARLDAAGPSKPIAQIASVIGREFEPDIVDAVAGRLQGEARLTPLDRSVRAHLDRLVESRLVEPSPQGTGRLRFRHALVAQAAYESQLLEERPERHEAVAWSMLESERTGRPADHAVIAQHFDEAGRPFEAVGQYLDAARRGHAVGAFPETIEQLRRASELLEALPEAHRQPLELAVCLSRGLAVASTGGYAAPGVVTDYQRAIDLCGILRDAEGARDNVLRALLGLWGYYCAAGDVERCTSVSDAFRQQLAVASMPAGPGSFHACRGVECFIAGDLRSARQHLTLALELLRDDEPDAHWPLPNDPLAASLAFVSNLELLCGDESAALAAIDAGSARSERLAFPLGPFSLAFVRMYESWVHRMRGCFGDAERAALEIIRIGERHGFFDWQMTGRIHLAAAQAAAEPSLPALAEMGEAIAMWRGLGGEVLLPPLIVERGWGYLSLGELGQATECLEDAEAILPGGQRLAVAEALRLRAELAARSTEAAEDDVAEQLRAAMRHARDQGARLFVLRCGASYQRVRELDELDDDLRDALDDAVSAFGPGSPVVRLAFGDLTSTG